MNEHCNVIPWMGAPLFVAAALLVLMGAGCKTAERSGFDSNTFEPFVFLHFGDPQLTAQKPESESQKARFAQAVSQANELNPAFVLIGGDLVSERKPEEWAAFDEVLGQLEVPAFLVPGNHDMSDPQSREEYVTKYGKDFYSITYNNCCFIFLDSELVRPAFANTPLPAQQWEFLEGTLKEAKAQGRSHIFISTHCPPYYKLGEIVGGNPAFTWPPEDRKRLLTLAREYNVQAILCGHLHNTKEVVPEDKAFTIYITTGTAFEFSNAPVYGYRIFKVAKDSFEQQYVDLNQPVEEKKKFIGGE